jgi:iron complex outermembrane recepter protein
MRLSILAFSIALAMPFTLGAQQQPSPSQSLSQSSAQSPSQTASQNSQSSSPPAATVPVRQEAIVVTGTYEAMPLNEIDRAVSVIGFEGSPELYGSFSDLLQSDASMDLEQRGPGGVQGDLSIRGSTFAQTLVLVDGFRFDDVQSPHHDLDLPLPVLALDHVEELRGTGSTFYGSDAIGGVVNFITATPSRTELRVGSEAGSFGTNDQDAELAYATKRFGELIALDRQFSTGFMPDRDYRVLLGSSDTSFKSALGETRLLLLSSDRTFGADQFYGPYDSWERTKAWFGGLTQDLGSAMQADLGFRRHTDNFILFRDDPSFYANNHETQDWQAGLRRKDELKDNFTLFSGVEGFHDSIDSNSLGVHARNIGAAYVDLDTRVLHRFSFSAGLREEMYGALQTQASPTFSGGVWLKTGLKLRANVSRAFRLPDYTDLYYSDPATIGNPNLKPESAWNYEGGLTWSRGRFRSDATAFYRREHNVIDYESTTAEGPFTAANVQQLNFTGAELSAGMHLAPWQQQLQVSYTALKGTRGALGDLYSRYAFNYPVHHAVAEWYAVTPLKVVVRTRIGALQRYGQDAYGLWDFGVSRSFGYVIAHANLANITDTQYQEIAGVPMPGRSVLAGVEFAFPKLSR